MNEQSLRKYIRTTLNEAFDNNLMEEKLEEMEGEGSPVSVRYGSDRKGPSKSATDGAVGDIQTGNDGKEWRIQADKNGTHSWKTLEEETINEEDLDETMMTSIADDKNMTAPDGRERYEEGIGKSLTMKKGMNDQSHNNEE